MPPRNRWPPIPPQGGPHGGFPQPNYVLPPFIRSPMVMVPTFWGVPPPLSHEQTKEAHYGLSGPRHLLPSQDLQLVPALNTEIKGLKHEAKQLRDSVAYEKKKVFTMAEEMEELRSKLTCAENAKVMETNRVLTMAEEMEELRAKLADAENAKVMENNKVITMAEEMEQLRAKLADAENAKVMENNKVLALAEEMEKLRAKLDDAENTLMMENSKALTMADEMEELRPVGAGSSGLIVQSIPQCPKAVEVSMEILGDLKVSYKKKKNKRRKAKKKDEIQHMGQTKVDTTTQTLAKVNVNRKRKRRRIKKKTENKVAVERMVQVDGMLNLHLSDNNHGGINDKLTGKEWSQWTALESEISPRTAPSLSDLLHHKENPLDLCKDKEVEVSVRKESSLPDLVHDKDNPMDGKDEEIVMLPGVVEGSRNQASTEIVKERSDNFFSPMEVEGEVIPCEIQHSPSQMDRENTSNKANDEIIFDQGQCSAEYRTAISTCDVEMAPHLCSTSLYVKEAECSLKDLGKYPTIEHDASSKRKLLVLDVNGLLANIVMPAPEDCRGDMHILGRAIFSRPFCQDFLNFCFQNFDVGLWSSIPKRIADEVVNYLLGDLKDQLLFCWDMTYCTQAGYIHKSLFCKDIRNIWQNDDPDLPWKNGDYNESNTLLLGNSPHEALLNPLHTAIFPGSYYYKDRNDNLLGPGGSFRVYLEGLLRSEDVRKYVEQHPLVATSQAMKLFDCGKLCRE